MSSDSLRTLILALLLSASVPASVTAQVRVGPLFGASLLEHTDTSLSHGPLDDAASVGRTVLVGAVVDLRFTALDSVSAEVVIGPYRNDLDRYCISDSYARQCVPHTTNETSHAIIVDLQYARALGGSSWRPYVGGGFGFKRYSFKDDWAVSKTSAAVLASVGVRSSGARPVRMELTGLAVPRHPILNDKTQFEVQARVIALLF